MAILAKHLKTSMRRPQHRWVEDGGLKRKYLTARHFVEELELNSVTWERL